MTKIILALVWAIVFAAPSFAVFSEGNVDTFAAKSVKSIVEGNGNDFEKYGTSQENRMRAYFESPCSGDFDLPRPVDDLISVEAGIGKNSRYTVFETTSPVGTAGGLCNQGQWQNVTLLPPVTLDAGQRHGLGFELDESRWGDCTLITNMDVDTVSITKIRYTPAPGALLLSSIGVGLVGWLRSRKAL